MASRDTKTLSGWGGVPTVAGRERLGEDLASITADVPLTRGLGRSYGDASLPPPSEPLAASSRLADRFLRLDLQRRLLRVEAGASLASLNRLLWPRGLAAPVSPGTEQVTVGGMVAADVHGKNHHRSGTLGRHVTALRMRLADGSIVECSRERESELFLATLGGMGLTGHLIEVEMRLEAVPSAWIEVASRRFSTLKALAAALAEAATEWPMTAAWVDGLRGGFPGVLLCGRWADAADRPPPPPPDGGLAVPFPAPAWLLNRVTIGAYNRLHDLRSGWAGQRIVHPRRFLYPLDGIGAWNRLYGRRGLTQWQCVIPAEAGADEVEGCLVRVRNLGGRPFLIVLKDFGEAGDGVLTFPRRGMTLAIDFPVDGETRRLIDGLNEWLLERGGRVYLAKDAFTRREHFEAMERQRLPRFQSIRDRYDPDRRLRSRLSVRLMGDPE